MGKITIRETNSVGDSFSEVEYIFEDSSDYFAWSEYKQEALNKAVKSYADNFSSGVEEVSVKKKETKH